MRRDHMRAARLALLAVAVTGLLVLAAGLGPAAPAAEAAPQVWDVCCNNIQYTIDFLAHNGDVLLLRDETFYECPYVWKKVTIIGFPGATIDSYCWEPAVWIAAAGVKVQGLRIIAEYYGLPAVYFGASNSSLLTNVLENVSGVGSENFAVRIGSVWDPAPRKFNTVAGNWIGDAGDGILVGDQYDSPPGTNRDSDNTLLNNLIAGPIATHGGDVYDGIEVVSKANHVNFNVVLGTGAAFELDCPNTSFLDVGKCNSAPDKNQVANNVFWDSDDVDVYFETNVKSTKNFPSNTFMTCDDDNDNNLCP